MVNAPGGNVPQQLPPVGGPNQGGPNQAGPNQVAQPPAAVAVGAAAAPARTAYTLQSQDLQYQVKTGQMVLQIKAQDQNGQNVTIRKAMNVSVEGAGVCGKVALAMVAKFKDAQVDKQLALEFLQNEADNANRRITNPPSPKTKLAVDFDQAGFTVERMRGEGVVGSRHVQVGALLGPNQQRLQELQSKHREGIDLATTHVQCRAQVDALFRNTRARDIDTACSRIFGASDPVTIGDLPQAHRHGLDDHERLATLIRAPENAGIKLALVQRWKQAREEVQDEIEQGSLHAYIKNRSKDQFDIEKPSIGANPLIQIITQHARTPVRPPAEGLGLEEQLVPPGVNQLVANLNQHVGDAAELARNVEALQPQERIDLATHLPGMVARSANNQVQAQALTEILTAVQTTMTANNEAMPAPPPQPPPPPQPAQAAQPPLQPPPPPPQLHQALPAHGIQPLQPPPPPPQLQLHAQPAQPLPAQHAAQLDPVVQPRPQHTPAELDTIWAPTIDGLSDQTNERREAAVGMLNSDARQSLLEVINRRAAAVVGVNSQFAENLRSLQAMLTEYNRLHP